MEEQTKDFVEEDQNIEEELDGLSVKEMYKKLYKKIKQDVKEESAMTKCSNDDALEAVDKMKFKKLIADYKNFKRKNVQHFKFSSGSSPKSFGRFFYQHESDLSVLFLR